MVPSAAPLTLVDRLWRPADQDTGRLLRMAVLAFAGAALLTLSAKVQVPMYPVPMTMQTLVVLLIGAAYGSRLGVATVLLYLAQGFVGLPVFANTPPQIAGPAYFLGTTGGFLVGFVLAAAIVGYFADRGFDRRPVALFGVMLAAHLALFVPGVAWLAFFAQFASGATGVGFERALALGFTPFILGTLVKVALGALIVTVAWRGVGSRAA